MQTITGGGAAGAHDDPAVPITLSTPVTEPIGALQPGGAPNIPAGGQDGLDDRFSGTIVQVGSELWAAQTVLDTATGTDAIAWYEINVSSGTPTITQQGLISDPNLFFYYPSVSANSEGNVVIGFSGSDATQPISSYAVYGTTSTLDVTTFSEPLLLKQGTGVYVGNLLTPQPTSPVTSTSTGTPPVVTLSPASSSFTESGTGDSDVITVRLAQAVTTTTTIDLGFSGTALANLDYTITAGVDAVVNSPGLPVQIVIPAGSTFGTITLTGAGLTLASNESVGVSVISVDGVAPAAPVNTSMTIGTTGFPVISIENLTVTEPGTSTAQVTIQLSGDAPSNMTVYYETAVDTAHPGRPRPSRVPTPPSVRRLP